MPSVSAAEAIKKSYPMYRGKRMHSITMPDCITIVQLQLPCFARGAATENWTSFHDRVFEDKSAAKKRCGKKPVMCRHLFCKWELLPEAADVSFKGRSTVYV